MQDAGGVGQSVELIGRNGIFPRADEMLELVSNQIGQTGLKVKVRSLEVGPVAGRDLRVKPGDKRTDLQISTLSDPVLDSSRVMLSRYPAAGAPRPGVTRSSPRS